MLLESMRTLADRATPKRRRSASCEGKDHPRSRSESICHSNCSAIASHGSAASFVGSSNNSTEENRGASVPLSRGSSPISPPPISPPFDHRYAALPHTGFDHSAINPNGTAPAKNTDDPPSAKLRKLESPQLTKKELESIGNGSSVAAQVLIRVNGAAMKSTGRADMASMGTRSTGSGVYNSDRDNARSTSVSIGTVGATETPTTQTSTNRTGTSIRTLGYPITRHPMQPSAQSNNTHPVNSNYSANSAAIHTGLTPYTGTASTGTASTGIAHTGTPYNGPPNSCSKCLPSQHTSLFLDTSLRAATLVQITDTRKVQFGGSDASWEGTAGEDSEDDNDDESILERESVRTHTGRECVLGRDGVDFVHAGILNDEFSDGANAAPLNSGFALPTLRTHRDTNYPYTSIRAPHAWPNATKFHAKLRQYKYSAEEEENSMAVELSSVDGLDSVDGTMADYSETSPADLQYNAHDVYPIPSEPISSSTAVHTHAMTQMNAAASNSGKQEKDVQPVYMHLAQVGGGLEATESLSPGKWSGQLNTNNLNIHLTELGLRPLARMKNEDIDNNDNDDDDRSVATSLFVEVASLDEGGSYIGYGGASASDSEESDTFEYDSHAGSLSGHGSLSGPAPTCTRGNGSYSCNEAYDAANPSIRGHHRRNLRSSHSSRSNLSTHSHNSAHVSTPRGSGGSSIDSGRRYGLDTSGSVYTHGNNAAAYPYTSGGPYVNEDAGEAPYAALDVALHLPTTGQHSDRPTGHYLSLANAHSHHNGHHNGHHRRSDQRARDIERVRYGHNHTHKKPYELPLQSDAVSQGSVCTAYSGTPTDHNQTGTGAWDRDLDGYDGASERGRCETDGDGMDDLGTEYEEYDEDEG